MNKIITLPEFFLINAEDYNKNPLWEKYINWLNEKYSSTFDGGNTSAFYGVNNDVPLCISRDNTYHGKFISIYQWYAAVNNVPDFTIPGTQIGNCIGLEYSTIDMPDFKNIKILKKSPILYTKKAFIDKNEIYIAADEYSYTGRNYFVYKLKDIIEKYKKEEKMEKELIGYKIKSKYIEAFIKLFDKKLEKEFYLNEPYNFPKDSPSWQKAKNLNILNVWFEEVYKEKFKLPIINRYEGVYNEKHNIIRYGCAVFPVQNLKTLYYDINNFNEIVKNNIDKYNRTISRITLSSGVEITIEELKAIIKFLEKNQNES